LTPKQSQTDKLKRYRKQKSEEYAQTILSTPQKTNLYSIVPYPGVVMIMGDIRTGKTGLAHEIANEMHRRSRHYLTSSDILIVYTQGRGFESPGPFFVLTLAYRRC